MAWQEYYLTAESGSSNLNAGTTSADASGAGEASATTTNGDWGNAAANRFTAASGTPFSGVSAGQWASVYLDAATSAVYVAKVTAVNAGGASIDLSTTDKIGTAPATGATGRSCKIGGAWASFAVANSLFASGTVNASSRVNVKAGTYSMAGTGVTLATAGATTAPLWWRGYKTTPGDMDGTASHGTFMAGTEIPAISFTVAALTISAAHQMFSNIDVQGAQQSARQLLLNPGGPVRLTRVRLECTNANSAGVALQNSSSNCVFESCWFKATPTAAETVNDTSGGTFLGCVIEGGANGVLTSGGTTLYHCVIRGSAGDGIRCTTSAVKTLVLGCTIYGHSSDGIEMTAAPSFACAADCVFSANGGYGIKNSLGTNVATFFRSSNLFHSNTSGTESGFGDSPSLLEQTDGSSPFTNAGSGDLSLVSTSNAKANGLPGAFENQSYAGYLDIGAVQRQEAGGGGAGVSGARIFTGF